MTARFAIPAFAAYGIELEYAIVDAATLDVVPIAQPLLETLRDDPLRRACGAGWSNEIVSHVVEVKNVQPSPSLAGLPQQFAREVRAANHALAPHGARLMPTGMHPWMDPRRETSLWTASDAPIYAMYDRLFDCRRHGWSNLQSMHLNLPFAGDAQFARLHTAIRLVLPLVPALAASSPFADARATGYRDYRLAVYATNSSRFPRITGEMIPDVVRDRRDYEASVLAPMYESVAASDPHGILRHEWLNSRGAIARFDRSAIEIRLADTQECPRADIAVAHAICVVARSLFEERNSSTETQSAIATERLAAILRRTIRDGEEAWIDDSEFLRALGVRRHELPAREAWRELLAGTDADMPRAFEEPLSYVLAHGTLATRILAACGDAPDRARLRDVYVELCECVENGRLFS